MAGKLHDLPAPEKISRERLGSQTAAQMKIKMLQFLPRRPSAPTLPLIDGTTARPAGSSEK
jgi:hypothetical protein